MKLKRCARSMRHALFSFFIFFIGFPVKGDQRGRVLASSSDPGVLAACACLGLHFSGADQPLPPSPLLAKKPDCRLPVQSGSACADDPVDYASRYANDQVGLSPVIADEQKVVTQKFGHKGRSFWVSCLQNPGSIVLPGESFSLCREIIFLENVKEHAPSPAGASVETGGEG